MAGYKRKRKGKKAAGAKKQKKVESAKESASSDAVTPTTDNAEEKASSSAEGQESTSDSSWSNAKSIYDFTVNTIRGESVSLEKYKNCVLLIVNVASKCGYTTKNYAGLVTLDEKYREQGLRILAFPCNQFGKQEPGDADKICEFVGKKNVKFDMFEKIEVNGKNAHPLYEYLKMKQPGDKGSNIKWNFVKFLVDKKGIPVQRYGSAKTPESLIPDIEKYLTD